MERDEEGDIRNRWDHKVRDVKSHREDLPRICCGRNWKKCEETCGINKCKGFISKIRKRKKEKPAEDDKLIKHL